jgi:hypothetical protein
MFVSTFAAACAPAHAEALNDLSLMPPVSVTTQALNLDAAEADTVVEATLTVKVPRISALVPSTVVRRRILPMYFSLNRLFSLRKETVLGLDAPRHGDITLSDNCQP